MCERSVRGRDQGVLAKLAFDGFEPSVEILRFKRLLQGVVRTHFILDETFVDGFDGEHKHEGRVAQILKKKRSCYISEILEKTERVCQYVR